jgi:hypothetical protein
MCSGDTVDLPVTLTQVRDVYEGASMYSMDISNKIFL